MKRLFLTIKQNIETKNIFNTTFYKLCAGVGRKSFISHLFNADLLFVYVKNSYSFMHLFLKVVIC
jgi:hypothetical protein